MSDITDGLKEGLNDLFEEVELNPDLNEVSKQIAGLTESVGLLVQMMIKKEQNSLPNKIKRGIASIQSGLHSLASSLSTGFEHLKKNFEKLGAAFGKATTSIANALKSVKTKTVDSLKKVGAKISDALKGFSNSVKSFFKDTMKPTLDKASAKVKEAFNKVMDKIEPHMQKAKAKIIEGAGFAKEQIKAAGLAVSNKATSAARTVKHGAQDMSTALGAQGAKLVKSLGQKLVDSGAGAEDRNKEAYKKRQIKRNIRGL